MLILLHKLKSFILPGEIFVILFSRKLRVLRKSNSRKILLGRSVILLPDKSNNSNENSRPFKFDDVISVKSQSIK